LATVVEQTYWKTTIEGQEVSLQLPFVCAKYRINARVVDFQPPHLEDFASWRKNTEYDALSDYSGSEVDSGDETRIPEDYRGKKTWEWRFALQLEEYDPKAKSEPTRLWVLVNNTEAQQLVNLDACE
jgi:protection of telomeres protein 1